MAVARAKIFIQSLWLRGFEWDTPLNTADSGIWRALEEELHLLDRIRVPRWLQLTSPENTAEIHGFADASERGYAAVLYLRTFDPIGSPTVSLILAKSRVAPLKQVSLPRLELCGASLLTKVTAHAQAILRHVNLRFHLWTDSTVVLGWVQGHPSRWKTYVANRVADIQRRAPNARWHHVRSQDNPADCASRGLSPSQLIDQELWWHGPPWLTSIHHEWLCDPAPPQAEELPEQRASVQVATTEVFEESTLLIYFSSLQRLMRFTVRCRRWLHHIRVQGSRSVHHGLSRDKQAILTVEELEAAERLWTGLTQAVWFKGERMALSRNQGISRHSPLSTLTPFIDELGIMRVGGWLKLAVLSYDERHPVILPRKSHLTKLIISVQSMEEYNLRWVYSSEVLDPSR